jgi:hypothetical protein
MRSSKRQTVATALGEFREPRQGEDPVRIFERNHEVSGRAFVALQLAALLTGETLIKRGTVTLAQLLELTRGVEQRLRAAAKHAARTRRRQCAPGGEASDTDRSTS